ncbi:beta-phosphoglucomutase family hydrolase [Vibrio palustris]|uniref:Fructose-1-phosphate phosphatase YqaB n=1 Tax=Vibrio palustris TaxID=1918946 RepID=A0A1R4B701_9VIBR|nr:beta-phosphoglucomutase family hydrolase [Vibrio palustris]SJL84698.1 Fructose-1-phosphate phosphatase YqaB [Vibrio palustris]
MAIELNDYAGLIFDMDGTLVDTMPAHLAAWEHAAQTYDFPFDAEWLNSMGGMPSIKIVDVINERYHLQLNPQVVSDCKMTHFASLEGQETLISATTELVHAYYGKKPLAVGTGSQRTMAMSILARTGLLNKFDAVVTATDVTNHKPHPETFLSAAAHLNLRPEQCVVFEDTLLGMQAAHSGGMDCILVTEEGLVLHPVPLSV